MTQKPKRALVLGGGGAHGSYQIGVWQALREIDWQFDIVTGTSVGALNGAIIAQGDFDTAVEMWHKIQTGMVFDVEIDESLQLKEKVKTALLKFMQSAVKDGGGDDKGLRTILENYVDENRIRNSKIDYGLVTLNATKLKPVEVMKKDIPEGELIDYMLASAAIFPAIKPQVIDNAKYIDGGIYNNLPINLACENGAEDIIAVDIKGLGFKREVEDNSVRIRTLKTRWDLGKMLIFEKDQARYNMRLGYLETLKLFSCYDGDAYTFIKGSISRLARLKKDKFFSLCDLCCVSFTAPYTSLIEKSGVKALKRVLNERDVHRFGIENVIMACAEIAGEAFSLDPTIIYSPERFCEHLEVAMKKHSRQYKQVISSEEKTFSIASAKKYLSLVSKELRIMMLSKIISENVASKKPVSLSPLAAILPSEFLAALYICTVINTDILSKKPLPAY